MADKEPINTKDPDITDRAKLDRDSSDGSENPERLAKISFKAGGETVTVAVGDTFVADNGQIVGEVDRIVAHHYDTSKRINPHETVHWVWIDYGKGGYHVDTNATGGIPLGEAAKQIANNDMSVGELIKA